MSKKPAVDQFAAARPTDFPFLLLAALFITALVTCNLIMRKFITVDLGFYTFEVSAGILPYPVTFLVTDLISEIYGRKRANRVVTAGIFASVFALGIIWLGHQFPALARSDVSNAQFEHMFASTERAVTASMLAYLMAQYVDVWLFHFWRRLTRGRHLWLRNNCSTIFSQFVDSTLVVVILFHDDPAWSTEQMISTIRDMCLFKALVAVADTPLFYGAVALFGRWRTRPL